MQRDDMECHEVAAAVWEDMKASAGGESTGPGPPFFKRVPLTGLEAPPIFQDWVCDRRHGPSGDFRWLRNRREPRRGEAPKSFPIPVTDLWTPIKGTGTYLLCALYRGSNPEGGLPP